MEQDQMEVHETRRRLEIHSVMSFVIALVIVMAALGAAVLFYVNRVTTAQEEPVRAVPTVVAEPVEFGSHEVRVFTQGVVESRREVRLAAEVAGRVNRIAAELVRGGRVEEGEVLVEIEAADYQAVLARSEAALADAELLLAQEEARQAQAERDWAKLGRGEASPLVLRVPQIASAKAKIESAEKEVERAARDVDRTKIRAPFDGRVRTAGVEAGAVVTPGTMVAEIYSDTDLEVRLPFSLDDFGYLKRSGAPGFEVSAMMGTETRSWPAELVRVEGEIDRKTLSGQGIAKILPGAGEPKFPPVGLFVEANVPGETLEKVVEIPRAALRGSDEIWVVSEGRLAPRIVKVLRSMRETLIVTGDLRPGDQLVLTRLSTAVAGMEVKVKGESEPESAE